MEWILLGYFTAIIYMSFAEITFVCTHLKIVHYFGHWLRSPFWLRNYLLLFRSHFCFFDGLIKQETKCQFFQISLNNNWPKNGCRAYTKVDCGICVRTVEIATNNTRIFFLLTKC